MGPFFWLDVVPHDRLTIYDFTHWQYMISLNRIYIAQYIKTKIPMFYFKEAFFQVKLCTMIGHYYCGKLTVCSRSPGGEEKDQTHISHSAAEIRDVFGDSDEEDVGEYAIRNDIDQDSNVSLHVSKQFKFYFYVS